MSQKSAHLPDLDLTQLPQTKLHILVKVLKRLPAQVYKVTLPNVFNYSIPQALTCSCLSM